MKRAFLLLSFIISIIPLYAFDLAFKESNHEPVDISGFSVLNRDNRSLNISERFIKDASQLVTIPTRAGEGESCYINGSIFNDHYAPETIEMIKNSDGTFTLTPGETFTGQFFLIYNPGNGEESRNLYSRDYEILEIGKALFCAAENNYYFLIYGGNFTFTFDPSAMTLTVDGTQSPIDYYLTGNFNSNVILPEYKLTASTDVPGIYTLNLEGVISSKFYITSGLESYQGTPGKTLKVGEPYQTLLNSGETIQTEDEYNIVSPQITFNPFTKELTITGEYQEPEYEYYIFSYILMYGYDIELMSKNRNGQWSLNNKRVDNDGRFCILRRNIIDEDVDLEISAEESEFITLNNTYQCVPESGEWFKMRPGTYTLTFDPQEMTLVATGTISPEVFSLINYSPSSPYVLTQDKNNPYLYTSSNIRFLPSEFYISSNYGKTFGSNGSLLMPGEEYLASEGDMMIETLDNLNFINCTVTFNSETGVILVNGQTRMPDYHYALEGNIFDSNGNWKTVEMEPYGEGLYRVTGLTAITNNFNIRKYDLDPNQIYCYYGPELEEKYLVPGVSSKCIETENYFTIEEGNYDIIFDPSVCAIMVYETSIDPKPLFLTFDEIERWPDAAELSFSITSLEVPEGASYTVFYKKSTETSYSSHTVNSNNFKVYLTNLVPITGYVYDFYIEAQFNGNKYISDILQYEFHTPYISINGEIAPYEIADIWAIMSYNVESNLTQTGNYKLNYASMTSDIKGNTGELLYRTIELESENGQCRITGLNPESYNIVYYYFSTDIEGNEFISPVYFVGFDTEKAGIDEISDNTSKPKYYNLNGIKVDNPQKGVYIEVKEGKTRKIYIK